MLSQRPWKYLQACKLEVSSAPLPKMDSSSSSSLAIDLRDIRLRGGENDELHSSKRGVWEAFKGARINGVLLQQTAVGPHRRRAGVSAPMALTSIR